MSCSAGTDTLRLRLTEAAGRLLVDAQRMHVKPIPVFVAIMLVHRPFPAFPGNDIDAD